jgi:hypothetical protein
MAGAWRGSNFDKFLHNQRHAGSLNDINVPTVDKIVDIHSPKFHRVQQPRLSKLLNLKMRSTVAHLRLRRIPVARENALFSVASV